MAGAALTPQVRMMAICDRVRKSKTEVDVYHLKGVRQAIAAPHFPFLPSRLCLFLVLSSPQAGSFTGYLRIVNDRTEHAIFYSYLRPRPVFEVEGKLCFGSTSIRCEFPEEGNYTIQICFFQEQGHDVLKGETTLYVTLEG